MLPYPVAPIVRSHHEQWNGYGYPDGLKGEEIPIGARILSVVDCFDALASDRPYRRALPLSGAVAHVQRLAGIEFDPEVVRIFSQHYEELEAKARDESRKIQPLNTDIIVRRGKAPSAGLEQSEPPAISGHGLPESDVRRQDGNGNYPHDRREPAHGLLDDTLPCVTATLTAVIPFDMLMIYVREGEKLRPHYVSGATKHQSWASTCASRCRLVWLGGAHPANHPQWQPVGLNPSLRSPNVRDAVKHGYSVGGRRGFRAGCARTLPCQPGCI